MNIRISLPLIGKLQIDQFVPEPAHRFFEQCRQIHKSFPQTKNGLSAQSCSSMH